MSPLHIRVQINKVLLFWMPDERKDWLFTISDNCYPRCPMTIRLFIYNSELLEHGHLMLRSRLKLAFVDLNGKVQF